MMSVDRLLSYTEASEYAEVTRQVIVTWVDAKLLNKKKERNVYVVSSKELDALLEIRKRYPRSWKDAWREERKDLGYE